MGRNKTKTTRAKNNKNKNKLNKRKLEESSSDEENEEVLDNVEPVAKKSRKNTSGNDNFVDAISIK